jgi:hypothetical protein
MKSAKSPNIDGMIKIKFTFILLWCFSFCGCSLYKKFTRPNNAEKIYAESSLNYSDEDDPEIVVESTLKQAKQNAIKKVVEIFVTQKVAGQRKKDLNLNILSNPDDFIESYKILKEEYTDNSYMLKIRAYVKIEEIVNELDKLKLVGKKRPKKVIIYPQISSKINISKNALLNPITDKLTENLYSANLFSSPAAVMVDTDTILGTAKEQLADYVMVVSAKVYKLEQGAQFISGFYPYRANVDLKIYSVEKKDLIAQNIKQSSGFGNNPKTSAETSVQKAIKLVLAEITFPFEKAKSSDTPVILSVKSLKTLERLKKFYDMLMNTDTITDFSLTGYKRGGNATFEIYVEKLNGQELSALILRKKPFDLTVEETNKYKITLNAQ